MGRDIEKDIKREEMIKYQHKSRRDETTHSVNMADQ